MWILVLPAEEESVTPLASLFSSRTASQTFSSGKSSPVQSQYRLSKLAATTCIWQCSFWQFGYHRLDTAALTVHYSPWHWEKSYGLHISKARPTSDNQIRQSIHPFIHPHCHIFCVCFQCAWANYPNSAPRSLALVHLSPMLYSSALLLTVTHKPLVINYCKLPPVTPLVSITMSCLEEELGKPPENMKHSTDTAANKEW